MIYRSIVGMVRPEVHSCPMLLSYSKHSNCWGLSNFEVELLRSGRNAKHAVLGFCLAGVVRCCRRCLVAPLCIVSLAYTFLSVGGDVLSVGDAVPNGGGAVLSGGAVTRYNRITTCQASAMTAGSPAVLNL